MKFGQILVCCMTNISNIVLAQCWRLKRVPGLFMILLQWQYNKIWRHFLIVDILPLLIVPYLYFQKSEILEFWDNWLLSN